MTFKNHKNPSELPCFVSCASCHRCQDKGKHDKCGSCSGRHDPTMKRDPYYVDDRCRCKEGVMQYRLQTGKMLIRQFSHNPFQGGVQQVRESEDERDWNAYLKSERERRGDPSWDAVQFQDGSSTTDDYNKWKNGKL